MSYYFNEFLYFFTDWLIEVKEPVQFERLPKDRICLLLKRFYAEVRNQDGNEYGKKSLVCLRAAIQRHINEPPFNVNYNLVTDPAFIGANNVLKGHIKVNKASGLDVSESYPPITKADKTLMYSSGTLSNDSPKALQHKVYYELTLHFGRRAREGLHDLEQKDFVFKCDSEGIEYATLAYNPAEKNHTGLSQDGTEHEQRMYGTGKPDCPLKTLKMYLSKLTPSNTAFFQTPKAKGWKLSTLWYTRSPVGVNTIGKFMPTISVIAKLSKVYTNHCIRATCVTTLRNAGCQVNDIKSVTGHKSTASIDSYSKTPDKLRRNMSHTLAGMTDESSQNESKVAVVNVQSTPTTPGMFCNAIFKNCTVTVNYK